MDNNSLKRRLSRYMPACISRDKTLILPVCQPSPTSRGYTRSMLALSLFFVFVVVALVARGVGGLVDAPSWRGGWASLLEVASTDEPTAQLITYGDSM